MNINKFMDLPLKIVMKLYRDRMRVEQECDDVALMNLRKLYPELFSKEFEDFIEKIKVMASDLMIRYEENFLAMFEDSEKITTRLN